MIRMRSGEHSNDNVAPRPEVSAIVPDLNPNCCFTNSEGRCIRNQEAILSNSFATLKLRQAEFIARAGLTIAGHPAVLELARDVRKSIRDGISRREKFRLGEPRDARTGRRYAVIADRRIGIVTKSRDLNLHLHIGPFEVEPERRPVRNWARWTVERPHAGSGRPT